MKRYMAAFVKRAHGNGKRFFALVALVKPLAMRFALHKRGLVSSGAVRAYRAVGPDAVF